MTSVFSNAEISRAGETSEDGNVVSDGSIDERSIDVVIDGDEITTLLGSVQSTLNGCLFCFCMFIIHWHGAALAHSSE